MALTGPLPVRDGGPRLRALAGAVLDALRRVKDTSPTDSERDRADVVARAGLLVWVPVLMSCGIGGWFALPFEPDLPAYLAAGAVLMGAGWLAVRRRRDTVRLGGVCAAVIAAGFLLTGLRAVTVAAPVLDWRYYGPVTGTVVAIDRSARDRMRVTLADVTLNDVRQSRTPARIRLSLMAPQDLPPPGARVSAIAHLGPPPGPAEPGGFDFRRSAFFDRLGAVGYTRAPIQTLAPAPAGAARAETLRLRLSRAMQGHIGGQEGAVAAALMTGDRSGIAERTNQIMRDANLYHIVSISGLHMSMLAAFVYAGLRLVLAALSGWIGGGRMAGWPLHKAAAGGAMAAAAGYLWLAGPDVAPTRAFIMVAVMLAAIMLDRRAISLRTVAVAATAILAAAPDALVTPGFQMSFAATVALIALFPSWNRRAARLPWPLRGAMMLILSSLIAGLATAPIAAAHFNRAAQYGLIANLLTVPAMGALVMPAGVIAALLAPLGLAGPALWVMGLGTRWMLAVAETVAGWGGAVTAFPSPHWTVLPLIGGGALVALLTLRRGGGRWQAGLGIAALTCAALGFGIWFMGQRPMLLIADEAAGVGIMTPGGRALSKPSNAFVAESWLRADGDTAAVEYAASRPGWSGPREVRAARLGEVPVVHLSGKGAAARLAELCHGGALVVLAGYAAPRQTTKGAGVPGDGAAAPVSLNGYAVSRWPKRPPPDGCLIVDRQTMRGSGALALSLRPDGSLIWQSATGAAGSRFWSSRRVRREWGYAPPREMMSVAEGS